MCVCVCVHEGVSAFVCEHVLASMHVCFVHVSVHVSYRASII